MSALITALATVAGGPAAGAAAAGGSGLISNLFGGPARDASRQQNVDWYTQAAIAGSVIAARVIIGAPPNVASNEDPMWIAAAGKVQAARPDVWSKASALGGYWVNGTIQMVQQELQNLAASTATTTSTLPATTSAGSPQLLAGMTTIAQAPKSSWLTIGILAVGAMLVLLLVVRKR